MRLKLYSQTSTKGLADYSGILRVYGLFCVIPAFDPNRAYHGVTERLKGDLRKQLDHPACQMRNSTDQAHIHLPLNRSSNFVNTIADKATVSRVFVNVCVRRQVSFPNMTSKNTGGTHIDESARQPV